MCEGKGFPQTASLPAFKKLASSSLRMIPPVQEMITARCRPASLAFCVR
jgi:hypothetical protein